MYFYFCRLSLSACRTFSHASIHLFIASCRKNFEKAYAPLAEKQIQHAMFEHVFAT